MHIDDADDIKSELLILRKRCKEGVATIKPYAKNLAVRIVSKLDTDKPRRVLDEFDALRRRVLDQGVAQPDFAEVTSADSGIRNDLKAQS